MLAASLNAFFCASPIYGSAEDFTFLLDFTPCEGVTPAAKQQIGETRKKRLAQRLAFFRFDNPFGIIKGEQPLIRASRASKVAGAFLVLFWCAKENLAPMQKQSYPALPTREAAQKKKSQCSTWNTGPLPSPLCRCRRDAHGILNVPIPLFPVRRCRYTVVRHQADGVVDGIHKNADVLHH